MTHLIIGFICTSMIHVNVLQDLLLHKAKFPFILETKDLKNGFFFKEFRKIVPVFIPICCAKIFSSVLCIYFRLKGNV